MSYRSRFARADAGVIAWFDAQAPETLYLAAVTVAESRFVVAVLPAGKPLDALGERFGRELLPLFESLVLSFDLKASRAYAEMMDRARAAGRPIGATDTHIATTAAASGLAVATRDVESFQAAGLKGHRPLGEG